MMAPPSSLSAFLALHSLLQLAKAAISLSLRKGEGHYEKRGNSGSTEPELSGLGALIGPCQGREKLRRRLESEHPERGQRGRSDNINKTTTTTTTTTATATTTKSAGERAGEREREKEVNLCGACAAHGVVVPLLSISCNGGRKNYVNQCLSSSRHTRITR